MFFRMGIENNNDERTIAWALDHPGCFAYGQDSEEAQRNFPQAVREYVAWIARHEEPFLNEHRSACPPVVRNRQFDCPCGGNPYAKVYTGGCKIKRASGFPSLLFISPTHYIANLIMVQPVMGLCSGHLLKGV
jgi:hypothetical protein